MGHFPGMSQGSARLSSSLNEEGDEKLKRKNLKLGIFRPET
jgi:hypothetical protein